MANRVDLITELKKRFLHRMSPDTMRSGRFWKVALRLAQSERISTGVRADRLSLYFFLTMTADAYLGKRPVIWANLICPPELFHGSGVIPFYPEVAGAVTASAGLSERFLNRADEGGFSRDLCSFHRAILGAALEDFLPRPAMLVSASYPCDSGPLSFSFLAHHYGVPHIILDVPPTPEKSGIENLAEQLSLANTGLLRLSGLHGGSPTEGLARSIRLSNRAREYLLEVEEARNSSPCPLDGWDALGHLAVIAMMMGSEECVDFYRGLLAELQERLADPESDPQKFRLLWIHLKPYYPNSLGQHLKDVGAAVVCEELNRCFWEALDPREPFASLAYKMSDHYYVGPASRRAEELVGLARRYKVDGAVHFQHRGCRQSCGCSRLVRDELSSVGVKSVALEGDCVDPREYREGQILTRLDALLETI